MTRLAALLLLVACNGPTIPEDTDETDDTEDTDFPFETPLLPDDFEAALDRTGGCSDTWLQLWDDDGMVGMEIYRQGPLAVAMSGDKVDETLRIGLDDVDVRVQMAEPVAENYCTDGLVQRDVHAEYLAVSGTLQLTMSPPGAEYAPGLAGITLTDVVFRRDDGHEVVVESLSAQDIPVVRYWGG